MGNTVWSHLCYYGLCVTNKGLMPCVIEVCELTPAIRFIKEHTTYHLK